MKRALLVATSLLAMSTSASTAAAGGFVGLALGNQPAVNEEMETSAEPVGRSLRGFGGYRHGNITLEGMLNGFGVFTGRGDRTVYQLAGAFRFNLPLGNDFEAFGRIGLERTWLNVDDERYNLTGNGLMGGAGFEYRLTRVIAGASAFVDYTIHRATLKDTRNNTVDGTSRIWALGLAYGF